MKEWTFEYGAALYWYCTDFVINTANLVGATYFDVNSWLFFVAYPGVTLILLVVVLVQWAQLARLRHTAKAT